MREPGDDAELRAAGAAVRAEWRADEEEWTRAALEAWEHERTLVDIARECMHRGDTIAIAVSGHAFTGAVVAVGDDVVRVATVSGSVDVNLDVDGGFMLRSVVAANAGGTRGDNTVATFRARLLELERRHQRVEVGVVMRADTMVGVLRVGRGQVSVEARDRGRTYVPVRAVGWVRPVDVD
jgi:hypothetical protein